MIPCLAAARWRTTLKVCPHASDFGGTAMAKNRSVKAEEIIALSKKEGFLAKQLYVVFTTPTNGIGPVMENVKEHLAFQVRLEKEGTMFAAGPNWTDDEKSWDGDGMVTIRANSLADAKKWCTKIQNTAMACERANGSRPAELFAGDI